jgi:hypothetical protein
MHSVTRLGRVAQQLRSFAELHAAELEALARDLESTQPDLAARLRVFQQMQADEGQLVLDELQDIRAGLITEAEFTVPSVDPAVDSPKRARWLAEQMARDEKLRRPRSRRDFFGGAPHPPSSTPPRLDGGETSSQ